MMENISKKILDLEGHLNDKGLSLYAEAMKLRQVGKLPLEIQEHLQECGFCTSKVIELYELLEELDYSDSGAHPILGTGKDMTLLFGNEAENIDIVLQQLLDEAVEIPLFENILETQFAYRNTLGANALSVLSPTNEQLCHQELTFIFNKAIIKKCFISLTNHEERKFKEAIPLGTDEFVLDISNRNIFKPGLYYWKVMVQGERAIVGKIFIV